MQFDMVFEGGGAKGMVFVGALQALEAQGHEVGRLIGTSAGAITATLLAAGYDAEEMWQAMNETGADGEPLFAGFMDRPTAADFPQAVIDSSLTMQLLRRVDIPVVPAPAEEWADQKIIHRLLELHIYPLLFSFIEQGGLYTGNTFRNWIRTKLEEKQAGFGDMTLAQFHAATGKDLSLVISDTGAGAMRILNHRTAPDCPVTWAARMSMSIPFAYQEVIWKAGWGSYRTLNGQGVAVAKQTELTGNTVVDGGALSNFPLRMLISDDSSVKEVMGNTAPNRERVLGLLIDEDLEVNGAPPPPAQEEDDFKALVADDIKKLRVVQRVNRLVKTMQGAHDRQTIAANEDLICRLPARGYGTMEFDMTPKRKQALVAAGRQAMEAHLAQRDLP
jgi:predicted acylesterase/phospholipase RssA